jgi:hypothetical protein
LEHFLFTKHRIVNIRIENLKVLLISPSVPPQKKKSVLFIGMYQTIPILYEADHWEDPRTGVFIPM